MECIKVVDFEHTFSQSVSEAEEEKKKDEEEKYSYRTETQLNLVTRYYVKEGACYGGGFNFI